MTDPLSIRCTGGDYFKRTQRFMQLHKHSITLKNKWHLSSGSQCRMINVTHFCKQGTDLFPSSHGLSGKGRVEFSSVLCLVCKSAYNDGFECSFGPVHWALTLSSTVWPSTSAKEQSYERTECTSEKLWQRLLRQPGKVFICISFSCKIITRS